VPLATRFASLVAWSGPGADTSGAPVSVCLILDSSDISVSSATIEERGSIPRWGQRVNRPPPAPP
jgi:predicted nucleic acid-binding Zn ribbon protein